MDASSASRGRDSLGLSRGSRGRLLGPGREGRKQPGLSISLRHRPRERSGSPRGPVEEASTGAQQLGSAPSNSPGPEPE